MLTVMVGQSIWADSRATWLAQLLRGCNVPLQCDVGLQPRNPILRSIYYLRLSSHPQFHSRKEDLPINFRGKSVTLVSTIFHALVKVFVCISQTTRSSATYKQLKSKSAEELEKKPCGMIGLGRIPASK